MALPNLDWLRDSEALWKARHTYRTTRLALWRRRESHRYQKWHEYRYRTSAFARARSEERLQELRQKWYGLYREADQKVDKWLGLRDFASARLTLRREQIAEHAKRAGPNFAMEEFDCRDGTPVPEEARSGVRTLVRHVLEPMRDRFGACYVTSGYRHESYNAGIGGATRSYHIYDNRPDEVAADVTFATGTVAEWADYARGLGHGGVGEYRRSGFVHVDMGPRRNWWG